MTAGGHPGGHRGGGVGSNRPWPSQGILSGASVSPPVAWAWQRKRCLARSLELGHSESSPALGDREVGHAGGWREGGGREEGLGLQEPAGS